VAQLADLVLQIALEAQGIYKKVPCCIPSEMLRTIDLLVRPTVKNFALTRALRLREGELLAGARQAALAVNASMSAAVRGDGTQLDEMASAVEPDLHTMLVDEVRRGHEGEAANEMLAELGSQKAQLEGRAWLQHPRLVVGARRTEVDVSMHRLSIGSHLVVVGAEPVVGGHALWSVERQQELLLRHGCAVQMTVAFAAEESGWRRPAQAYTFEAAVNGRDLRDSGQLLRLDSEPEFALVDLNGMREGAAFWKIAAKVEVPWWWPLA
jgi:hypothetical protein